jgi:inosine-uridine nucleoside N-ribohydrolase
MKNLLHERRPDRREFLAGCGGMMAAGMLAQSTFLSGQAVGGSTPGVAAEKVIIDTDPGVDDAFALLLAMRSPELDIRAITAVSGNVPLDLTLPNALRLVEIAGKTNIPVAAGASSPLIRRAVTATYAHGENGLGGVDFPAPTLQPVKEKAADLICRLVRENAGDITIVGLGPLTNVALALRADPDIAKMIRRFVLMGGSLSGGNVTPAAEFNFYVDPEAASIVFDSGIPVVMVGLDVTRKVQLTTDHIRQLEAGHGQVSQAAAKIASKIMELYRSRGRTGGPSMNDPLAVAAMLKPDILTFEDYHIEIETAGDITAGESVGWKHGPLLYSPPMLATNPEAPTTHPAYTVNTKVATGVDSEKFFDLMIPRLL